jgi:hypothetical protein
MLELAVLGVLGAAAQIVGKLGFFVRSGNLPPDKPKGVRNWSA